MAISKKWYNMVRRKFHKSSQTDTILRDTKTSPRSSSQEETASFEEDIAPSATPSPSLKKDLTKEDIGAIRAGDSISTSSKKKGKGMAPNCFNFNVVLRRRSRRDIPSPSYSTEEAIAKEESIDIEEPNETASSARNAELNKETINFVNANGAASSTVSSEKKDLTIEDTAAIKIQAFFRGHLVRQTFGARESIATSSKKKKKGMPPNCFSIVQRRSRRRSPKEIKSPDANASRRSSTEEAIVKEETIKVKDEANSAASSTPSSSKKELTKEDVAAVKIQAIFRGHRARRAFPSLKSLVSRSKKKENTERTVRVSHNLFNLVRRKFHKTSDTDIIFPHNNPCARLSTAETTVTEETIGFEDANDATPSTLSSPMKEYLTEEDIAANKIQAFFRGHLARRAYTALRSLVKLQAVARGVCIRRQARIALHCMHALARLQVRVRARQLLNSNEVL